MCAVAEMLLCAYLSMRHSGTHLSASAISLDSRPLGLNPQGFHAQLLCAAMLNGLLRMQGMTMPQHGRLMHVTSSSVAGCGGRSQLTRWGFWRVVLDEAQVVANSNSAAACSVSQLLRRSAWVVTGTPITSEVQELQVWHLPCAVAVDEASFSLYVATFSLH